MISILFGQILFLDFYLFIYFLNRQWLKDPAHSDIHAHTLSPSLFPQGTSHLCFTQGTEYLISNEL